jgi:hypothetical protein
LRRRDGFPDTTGSVAITGAPGDSHEFRETVSVLGFDYALGIHATTTMWRLDSRERCRSEPSPPPPKWAVGFFSLEKASRVRVAAYWARNAAGARSVRGVPGYSLARADDIMRD